MQRSAILTPQTGLAEAPSRAGAWLRRAWAELTIDADERFLGQARDLADLERRQRSLERGRSERFGPLDPDA